MLGVAATAVVGVLLGVLLWDRGNPDERAARDAQAQAVTPTPVVPSGSVASATPSAVPGASATPAAPAGAPTETSVGRHRRTDARLRGQGGRSEVAGRDPRAVLRRGPRREGWRQRHRRSRRAGRDDRAPAQRPGACPRCGRCLRALRHRAAASSARLSPDRAAIHRAGRHPPEIAGERHGRHQRRCPAPRGPGGSRQADGPPLEPRAARRQAERGPPPSGIQAPREPRPPQAGTDRVRRSRSSASTRRMAAACSCRAWRPPEPPCGSTSTRPSSRPEAPARMGGSPSPSAVA